MTNYAHIEYREAWLCTEFGESFARRIFGDDAIDALPRYQRGKRKGAVKGKITWHKVERGGWVKELNGHGYVENRAGKVIDAMLIMPAWEGEDEIISVWQRG